MLLNKIIPYFTNGQAVQNLVSLHILVMSCCKRSTGSATFPNFEQMSMYSSYK